MAVTGGGWREPLGGVTETGVDDVTRPSPAARHLTLEQLAWRAANAQRELLDQSREETRGMLGFGKPHVARAGVAAYKALKRSYGENAPAVAGDLIAVTNVMRDQARKAD